MTTQAIASAKNSSRWPHHKHDTALFEVDSKTTFDFPNTHPQTLKRVPDTVYSLTTQASQNEACSLK